MRSRTNTFPLNDPAGLGIFLLMARALAPTPFQPDFEKPWGKAETRPSTTERTLDSGAKPESAGADAGSRRRSWMERLDRWFWAQQQRDIETYLAKSADVHDLEQRMRNLERSSWHRYN